MGAQFGLELEIVTLLYSASALGGPAFFVAIKRLHQEATQEK